MKKLSEFLFIACGVLVSGCAHTGVAPVIDAPRREQLEVETTAEVEGPYADHVQLLVQVTRLNACIGNHDCQDSPPRTAPAQNAEVTLVEANGFEKRLGMTDYNGRQSTTLHVPTVPKDHSTFAVKVRWRGDTGEVSLTVPSPELTARVAEVRQQIDCRRDRLSRYNALLLDGAFGTKATGAVTYFRNSSIGLWPVPKGSLIAARTANGTLMFVTTERGEFAVGRTETDSIRVTAIERGASGNIAADTSLKDGSRLPGINGIRMSQAFVGGSDERPDGVAFGEPPRPYDTARCTDGEAP